MVSWEDLKSELNSWQAEGKKILFWWRDDDAIEASHLLDQLLKISEQFQAPLSLAVIPELCHKPFDILETTAILQHGFSHQNNAGPDEKKCELHHSLINEDLTQRLEISKTKLEEYFPKAFYPCMTPPWNRMSPDLSPPLIKAGFKAISSYKKQTYSDDICHINTHIDIIDWSKQPRECLNEDKIIQDILSFLQENRQKENAVMGLLTHHLVHDQKTWDFLETLLGFLRENSIIQFTEIKDLIKNETLHI